MKLTSSLPLLATIMFGCVACGSPPKPDSTTVVVVPQDSKTVVVCSDGTHPPCR